MENIVCQRAIPIGGPSDLHPLFDAVGDSNIVMLGEASHGHEYYVEKYCLYHTGIGDKLVTTNDPRDPWSGENFVGHRAISCGIPAGIWALWKLLNPLRWLASRHTPGTYPFGE